MVPLRKEVLKHGTPKLRYSTLNLEPGGYKEYQSSEFWGFGVWGLKAWGFSAVKPNVLGLTEPKPLTLPKGRSLTLRVRRTYKIIVGIWNTHSTFTGCYLGKCRSIRYLENLLTSSLGQAKVIPQLVWRAVVRCCKKQLTVEGCRVFWREAR